MNKFLELNSQVVGRDKIARLIQYTSRAIWDSLEAADCNPSLSDRFKTLEYILSTFRKLLRFGRCVDVFYTSLWSVHYPDLAIRITFTLSRISEALFLLADHFLCVSRTGLFANIDVKKWSTFAHKYWFFSVVMNLCRDVYEIYRIIDLHKSSLKEGISQSKPLPILTNAPNIFKRYALYSFSILENRKDIAVDMLKNMCDLFIPLNALGKANLAPRTIGLLEAISSLASLIALWERAVKLSPL